MKEKSHDLISILARHSENTFRSMEILFDTFPGEDFAAVVNGFPIWRQFYHTLNSMDRIYTDPIDYAYPEFHVENMNDLEAESDRRLDKNTLLRYYGGIKENVRSYLSNLRESELYLKSNHQTIDMTKLDHILAQLRHMAWHIGYLHGCAKVKYGKTPEHILV